MKLTQLSGKRCCFETTNITHVEGTVDRYAMEIVETELMIADLDSLESVLNSWRKKAKTGGDKDAKIKVEVMEPIIKALREGKPARSAAPSKDNKDAYKRV